MVATDSGGSAGELGVKVTVTDVNEPPTVQGRAEVALSENDELFEESYFATDPEGSSTTFTWSVVGTDGGDFHMNRGGQGGVLTFRNTPDYERPADSNRNNEYLVQVRSSDGQYTGTLDVTITVEDVNEPPEFTSSSKSRTSFSVPENSTASLYTYRADDPENGAIHWSVTGEDGGDFNISNAGVLTFATTPDFEMPTDADQNNEYLVTVEVRYDVFNYARLEVTVNVTNASGSEEPTITTTSRSAFTFQENGAGTIYTFRATDPQGQPVTWSVEGTDRHAFEISSSGALTFGTPPDFKNPRDSGRNNVYEVTVVVTDEQGLTDSFDVTIAVTNHHENQEPAITTRATSGLTYHQLNYQENRTSTVYTYRATNYGSGSITWSVSGTDSGAFDISDQGALTFTKPPNYEAPADSGGGNDYEITVVATNTGSYADRLNVVITVTDVNEGPEITRASGAPGSVPETYDPTQVLARYTASDPEDPGAAVTRWSTSGTDGGDFVMNEQGELRFRNQPDYERPADSNRDNVYEFTVRASDGRYYGTFDETVTVDNVNEPPTITTTSSSATTLRQNENLTSRLYTYRATDPEGGTTITWSVGSVDGRFFIIDERGQFSFSESSPPDYENPGDSGGDNVYDVAIQVRDDGGNTASLPVTVTVTPVNEGPEVTSGRDSFTVSENQSLPNAVYTGSDPEGGAVTRWALGGRDGGDFNISQEGTLTFRSLPDYERPADSNRDNVYEVQIRPYDGRYYGSFDVTVTVVDVNEPPTITTTSSSATTLRQNENVTTRLYTYRATDPEGETITWLVGGVDRDYFAIDERGQFSFKADRPPDYEQPGDSGGDNVYNATVRAQDQGGITAELEISVTVTAVNEGPEVTSGRDSFAINENQSLPNAVYTGSDPEGGTVTRWALGGRDGGDFNISQDGLLTFRSLPDYERPADSNRDNVYEVEIRPYDGRYYGSFDVTVTVTDVNEPPTITTTSSSATTLRQNENLTSRLYTYRATDPEGGTTLTWSVGGVDRRFFIIDERGQFSFKEESPPDHENPGDSGGDNVYEVTIQATDDGSNTASLPVTVTVTEVNEGPEVTSGRDSFTVSENQSLPNAVYTGSDPEGGAVTRWALGGRDGGDFNISQEGTLTFRSLPDYERPADSNRDNVYEVQIRLYDGRYYGSFDVTVTVTDVNEPPTITTTSSSATNLQQPENRTTRLYTYRATDPEGETVTWSVAGVDGRFFAINERGELAFDETQPPDYEQPGDSGRDNVYNATVRAQDQGGITAELEISVTVTAVNEGPEVTSGRDSFVISENQILPNAVYTGSDPEGGAVTRWALGGRDGGDFNIGQEGTLTFRSLPDYERPADSNRDNVYEVEIRPYDGRYYGSFDVTVTVVDVNEPPTITTTSSSATTLRQNENLTTRLYTYRATDPEGGTTITWSVGGVDGRFFIIDERGQFSFSESSPPDYEIPGDSGGDNVYDATIQVRDDGGNTASLPVTVTVTEVNEGPEVMGTDRFTISENRNLTNSAYSARDPELSNVVSWRLAGRDAGDFAITQGGTLYFRSPPDYEQPADSNRDNVYEVSVSPSDGRNTGSFEVTVTVTDVNEPPEFRRGSTTYFTQPENRTSRLYTYSAADPEQGAITWTVGGTDGNFFAIDERGQFSFREESPPDFDTPSDSGEDNLYNVTIEALDPESNTATLPVTVRVTQIDEGPVITRQGSAPGSVRENQAQTTVLARYTASDPERPSVSITQWSVSGRDGGDFVINALGELRFRNTPDYERPADSNRDNVYELAIRASDGRQTVTLEEIQTVTVTDVDEAPTITTTSRTAFSQPENGTNTLYTFRATDPEGNTVAWTTAGPDGSAFTIDERGALSFANAPDFDAPGDVGRDNVYHVTVQASDGSNTASLEVTVTVTNNNEGVEPTISTRRPPSTYQENGTATVYTFRASDPQRGTITWTLDGDDRGDFTITTDSSGRGVLAFASPPDFESPADANRDNAYELAVVATDEEGYADRVDFTITVTNHNEGVEPTVSTRRPPATYRENGTSAVYTFRASDPQRQTIIWTLEGNDAGNFTITTDSSGRGVLAFASPPDFESLADDNQDNAYELAVVATDDDNNRDRVDFTITVTDINEGPEIMLNGTATTSVPENYADTGVLARYTARDPENPGARIYQWSTTGRDGGDFVISALGELRFRSSPDHERPADADRDNVYEVTVRAYDGRVYGMLEEPLMITVTEVNEAPVITTRSRVEFTLRENSTSIIYTYRATDEDEGDAIMWSVEGTDGDDFAIYSGMLTFRRLPNLEIPADANRDNEYELTVVAADRGGLRDAVDVTVTITDQAEGPVIAGTISFTVAENYDITQALGSYTATDAKDGRRVFPRWSLSGRDGGDFVIDGDSGALSFRNTPDYDRPADSDRDNVYEVTVRGHDSLAYGNLNVTVTVTNINEGAPVVTGRASHTVRENTTSAIYTYRATDPDLNDTITWSTGGADGGAFVINRDSNGRGLLAFANPPDFESPSDDDGDNVYDLQVVATDGGGMTGSLAVTVTVTALNEGPVVSGTATFTINENQDLTGATYTAQDPEAIFGTTTITWSVSGRDGGDFTIDRETGVLAFRITPNYERPADSNRDNVYELVVRAYDGRNYGTFDVTVTVLPVNEGPEITGRDSLSFRENTPVTTRLHTYRATDPEGNDFTWQLGGSDANDFEISDQGVLTFASPPNFDSPAGSGTHGNEYLVTVQARDGQGNIGELPVTVTITDQNEGAVVSGQVEITVQENRDPTLVLATYSATDPEGQAITRWSLGGSDGGDFTITEDGQLTFRSTPDYDRPADSNRDNEYLITVRAYDGGTYGNLDVTIAVTNINEHDPVIRSGSRASFSYREEGTSVLYTYSATDGDKDDTITWTASGADGNLFEFDDRNGLVFREPPDYENPGDSGQDNEYQLTVEATDSGGRSDRLDVTVTVTAVDEGP